MVSKTIICLTVAGLFGVVFLGVGVSLIYVFQNMIKSEIEKQVKLKPNTDTFNDWKEPPVPIYFQVWVFDVINVDEIIQKGAKPTVSQKGPYTYREHREKVNITFNDNSTVTYREDRSFVFEADMSAGMENDTFTNINIPFMTIVNMIRFEYGFIKELVDLVLEAGGENMFIELSVGDLLWGYEDQLLKDADAILKRFHINKTIDDHFGLFYNQNGSDDGVYNVYTGVQDSNRFGIIGRWNYNSSLPYWTTKYCNQVNGTDGTMYPPFLDKKDPIYIFSSDICRALYAIYNYTYTLNGIDLHRYIIPKETFLAPNLNPNNDGFCTPYGNCLPSGLLNVSNCRQGAPLVMSQPHFLAADQTVIDGVNGVHPNEKEHETVLDLEPMTGVVMNAAKKLQINIFVEPVDKIKPTEKIKPVFLPVMWLNESATIDDASANKFKDQVEKPVKITEAVQYGLITLGVFLLVCVLAVILRRTLCQSKDIEMRNMGGETDPLLAK